MEAGMKVSSHVKVSKRGKELEIIAEIPSGVKEIEVRLYSARNQPVSKLSDISPKHPQREKLLQQAPSAKEVFFPVIDVALEPGMSAVVQFDNEPEGYYVINGAFNKHKEPLKSQINIDACLLEHWENNLFVSSETAIQNVYLKDKYMVNERVHFRHTYALLSENWQGSLEIYNIEEGRRLTFLGKTAIQAEEISPERLFDPSNASLNKENIFRSLELAIMYIRNSQNRNPRSPYYQGLFLFYDHEAQTYRAPNWIWSSGPAVKLLLEAEKLPAFADRGLLKIGEQVGKASLLFTKNHLDHPAKHITTSRWKAGSQYEYGVIECHSAADANFLSGWAWIPLYEATGNTEFLDAARRLASATDDLIRQFEIAPMDYLEVPPSWTNWSIDEIGFATEGISELYRVTGEDKYRVLGETYIDKVLAKLERPDGLWDRSWLRNERQRVECEYMTRGLGWGMEGLIAAHRMSPSGKYLQKAVKMADVMIGLQDASGCWAHYANTSLAESGAAEKATSLWSLLLYRLYAFTKDPRHMNAARKALLWCMKNQYAGGDTDGLGGNIGCTPQSGVVYRQWYRLSCVYTSGFFGLALLEELKLMDSINQ